jgi:GABA(A) receptor-associated protein
MGFKEDHLFEKRSAEAQRILIKYKDRVPVIVEVSHGQENDLILDKKKYLIPYGLTVGQFLYVIRKRIKLEPEKALFVFFNNELPASTSTMGSVYKMYKDKDSFMYAVISLESTFG